MTTLNPTAIPKLRGQNDYPTWKLNITSAFLILDLSSTISPSSPDLPAMSNSTPDPLSCLTTMPDGISTSSMLSNAEYRALTLLMDKKTDWEIARKAEEVEYAKRQAEEKRKDEVALGWMFLTMDPMLAQEVLLLCSTKHRSDGTLRRAELRELDARTVWEKLWGKYSG